MIFLLVRQSRGLPASVVFIDRLSMMPAPHAADPAVAPPPGAFGEALFLSKTRHRACTGERVDIGDPAHELSLMAATGGRHPRLHQETKKTIDAGEYPAAERRQIDSP